MTPSETKNSAVGSPALNSTRKKNHRKRITSLINVLIGCGFLAMAGVLSSGIYWHLKRAKAQLADNSAYVELKLIDSAGQAVAGARVFEDDQPVGVTDSFGEWSKYGRFVLGETIQYRLTYRQDGKLLEVSRNFAMPLSSNQQVKFQATLQFGGKKPLVDSAGLVIQATSNESSQQAAEVDEQHGEAEPQSVEAKTEESANDGSEIGKKEVALDQSIASTEVAPAQPAKSYSLNFEERTDLNPDEQKIQVQLIEKQFPAISGGLKQAVLSSETNVVTSLVSSSTGEPMLMARAIDNSGKTLHGIVRGYMPDLAQATAIIRPPLKWLVENKGQFISPRVGWPKQQLNILGDLETTDLVFVGGYMARPDIKAGSFTYFGESLKAMNVTVVRKNQILHRARIVNRSWGNPSIVSLPASNVARR
jgi:hypothetical protein